MSDNDSGGGSEGLGLLLILVIGALIAIAGWVLSFIFEHRQEIIAGLKWIVRSIWETHLAVGRAALFVLRDLPVRYFWDDRCADRLVRGAMIFWLFAPVLLLGGLLTEWGLFSSFVELVLGEAAVAKLTVAVVTLCLWTFPSVAMMVYGYYRSYFLQPVGHYRWPRFVFQYQLLQAEIRLAGVFWTVQIQIWFVLHQAALMRTIATWLAQIAARLDLSAAQLALSASE
jgi:hypothetical protein